MSDRAEENRQNIMDAAVRCFHRAGVRNTNMAEIAAEAGLSRKTVYRAFADRSELLLILVNQRITLINHAVNGRLQRYATLEQALVHGIAFTVKVSKADALFNALVVETTDRSIESLIIDANDDIRELFAASWRPLLERARTRGELRSRLSDARLIEGIRNFVALLIIRSGQSEDEQRQFLKDFLVPAILGARNDQTRSPRIADSDCFDRAV